MRPTFESACVLLRNSCVLQILECIPVKQSFAQANLLVPHGAGDAPVKLDTVYLISPDHTQMNILK